MVNGKTRTKILYNIDKGKVLNAEIILKSYKTNLGFRTKYNGLQHRLLAFSDSPKRPEHWDRNSRFCENGGQGFQSEESR